MNIGIYIYDDAEVLDFSGPFEVFSTAKRLSEKHWNVSLIGETLAPITARGGFQVIPHFCINTHPDLDVVIIVGGLHNQEITNTSVINWVQQQTHLVQLTASVCTGAFILAETGILDGLTVTTHWEDIPELQKNYPKLTVEAERRWIKDGSVVTSGGISAGIDMSLYLVSELASEDIANLTATQMEYRWNKK
ncbi:DJ-1/PfpI family protein [Vibrio profundi]|uniref:DJ-1/PfpI family protein n=1 Tax=Vibrio profundi TaxID=1774960 RepID=UPI003735AEB9